MKSNKIVINSDVGEREIDYESVRAYHTDGNYAMLAATFQGIKGALCMLDKQVKRTELSILSGHPGTGVRDAFEFVFRALTRGEYVVDCKIPKAQYNPHKEMAYYFEISDGAMLVKATLKDGVLPQRFFELFGISKNGMLDKETRQEFASLKEAIEERVLGMDPYMIYEYEVD